MSSSQFRPVSYSTRSRHSSNLATLVAAVFYLLLALAGAKAYADENEFGIVDQDVESPESVDKQEGLNAAVGALPEGRYDILTDKLWAIQKTHFGRPKSFPALASWERRMSRDKGFDYALVNASVVQHGSEGGEYYADNEMDLYLQWRFHRREATTSRFYFWGTWVQTFSDLPNGAFSRSQDLLTGTISAGTDPGKSFVAPSALWWEQTFEKTGLSYSVGQLYATSLWGNNRYTADDREAFMNSVLSSNVGLPWSSVPRGLGGMVKKSTRVGYVAAGVQNANGDQTTIDFSTALDGKFLYVAEFAFTPNLNLDTEGAYKLSFGRIDQTGDPNTETGAAGWGLGLSARQEINDRIGLFAQYRRSFGGRVAQGVETSANAGLVFKQPFGWTDDSLGLGFLYAHPSDASLRDEFGAEVYWRLQLTHRLDITADIHLYRQRARADTSSTAIVVGARFRYIL